MHTRWHEQDLAGRILDEAKREPNAYNYGGFLRDRQREVLPSEWAALYQQVPAPEEGDFFKKEWFHWYDERPKHLQTYGASDYAVTAKGGDYTVHVVCGIDPEDNLYVLEVWRKQAESNVWVDAFLDLVAEYQPLCWAEEDGQIIKSLGRSSIVAPSNAGSIATDSSSCPSATSPHVADPSRLAAQWGRSISRARRRG